MGTLPSWPSPSGASDRPGVAAAAFAPAPANRLAAVVGVVVLAAGIAGGIVHIGLFFVPALVILAIGGVKLWCEQS